VTVSARLVAEGYEQTREHLERMARIALSPPDGSGAAHSGEAGARARRQPEGGDRVATVPVPGGAVEILPSEELDLQGANRRRAAQRARLEAEIERSQRKLENEGFVAKAPAAVVEAERSKLTGLRAELEALDGTPS
ncbi:MAG TPA: hypothetical protein VIX82_08600, partial [Solirubrobacteraceae bacterium]